MPGAIATTPSKAPEVIGPKQRKACRPTLNIPQYFIDEARKTEPATWNPDEHLAYQPPSNIVTMKDISLEGHGISETVISDPFPLFSREAIIQVRGEVFSEEVVKDYRPAPFTTSAWYDPQTIAKVSEVAGIDLVPALPFEVPQINISINDQNEEYLRME